MRLALGKVIICFVLSILLGLSFQIQPSDDEIDELASKFRFSRYTIDSGLPLKTDSTRPVNPNLQHIDRWFTSVGAGVALLDYNGDGIDNHICITDPRSGGVSIIPLPSLALSDPTPTHIALPGRDYDGNLSFPMGCRIGDFDMDGLSDLLIIFFGRSPLIYLQREAKSFEPYNFELSEEWYTASATITDLDGDGRHDIIFGNYYRDNDGIYNPKSHAYPQLHNSLASGKNGGPNRIFRNITLPSGKIQFEDISHTIPLKERKGWTLAVGAADLNKDGLPDLYIANDFGPDHLYLNRSKDGRIEFMRLKSEFDPIKPKSRNLGHDSFKGMGVDFTDINHDGILDIFVSNISGNWQLQEGHFLWVSQDKRKSFSEGYAPYKDMAESYRVSRNSWGWDAKFADFNNDGVSELIQATGFLKGKKNLWPELHQWAMGNDELIKDPKYWPSMKSADISGSKAYNPFYAMTDRGFFHNIADEIGLSGPWISRGIATGDVDQDGDLDIVLANQWSDFFYFKNTSDNENSSLLLDIRYSYSLKPNEISFEEQPHSYRAIGVQVKLNNTPNPQIGLVDGGNGHSGARSQWIHFGLGQVDPQDLLKITIQWPEKATPRQRTLELAPGKHHIYIGRQRPTGINP